ncbi:MAG: sigma-70 family RNA polymerase sigma factor [Verrucomicrobiota bacterium]|nr:sigma-70 family RNA polymerase sigma factor [Chthoniobacterales bacterium]MBA3609266.1 sigma-70 family RNA polymerase sigma factor [Chthoniobacterales bacterium]MDQ3627078.1 sigma-70 family RNA polymerase sigma factor [Verrucomicrobiota bacterium]
MFPPSSSAGISSRVTSAPPRQQVTRLLIDWGNGNRKAALDLMPLVYDELRQIARGYLQGERGDHILQATGLVHEAYLRLVDQNAASWKNRAHFFGVAARVMRRILVDHARRARTEKRGRDWDKLEFDDRILASPGRSIDLIALDEALQDLARLDPRRSQIVELRFFGGLTMEEAGEVLEVSARTVRREWRLAKAWLRREIMTEKKHAAAE